jgi:glycosyltransferase involved in cell wall biosynthesis
MQRETSGCLETSTSDAPPLFLSIVAPAYNEEAVLPTFHDRLVKVLDDLPVQYEILYVNDGSKDQTINILNGIRKENERVSVIDLSRNFGKELALTAGLDHASGDAVVVIDTDLQDPPEIIPDLVSKMLEGYDIVYAKRSERDGETLFKKLSAMLFYRFIQKFLYGDPVAGYPSLMAVMLFLGGIQLITIGIILEYLARTFNETKNRPL